jgi:hypothetical protein
MLVNGAGSRVANVYRLNERKVNDQSDNIRFYDILPLGTVTIRAVRRHPD